MNKYAVADFAVSTIVIIGALAAAFFITTAGFQVKEINRDPSVPLWSIKETKKKEIKRIWRKLFFVTVTIAAITITVTEKIRIK